MGKKASRLKTEHNSGARKVGSNIIRWLLIKSSRTTKWLEPCRMFLRYHMLGVLGDACRVDSMTYAKSH